MIPAPFEYAAAGSSGEALDLLARYGEDAKLLAGGHSLVPMMKLRLAAPSALVDIGRAADLAGVRGDDARGGSGLSPGPVQGPAARPCRGPDRRPADPPPRHDRRVAGPR